MRLMERQHTHYLSLRKEIDSYMVEVSCHKSKFEGEMGLQDKLARMNLSKYCYDKLWFPSFSYSFNLQYKLCDHGTHYRVWPSNAPLLNDNFTTIPIGGRCCECRMRLDFDTQCKHELCVHPKFKVKYNNKRWLNEESFEQNYPILSPMFGNNGLYQEISHSVNSFSGADRNEGNVEVANISDIAHENLLH